MTTISARALFASGSVDGRPARRSITRCSGLPKRSTACAPCPPSEITRLNSLNPAIVVSHAGARRALARHPWIFRGDLVEVQSGVANGDIVRVVDNRSRPLGRAMFSARSKIALRFVSFGDEPPDADFWARRLDAALGRRARAGIDGPARRLVFAEGDEWPGFIADQYGECIAIQTLTPAADRLAPEWTRLLVERFDPRAVVARNDVKVRRLEGLEPALEIRHGSQPDPYPVEIGERGFIIDLMGGQKTGAYLDQQDNYLAARRYAAEAVSGSSDGRKGLDAFAGEGGFALHLAGSLDRVDAIEISEAAAARGRSNADQNGIGNIVWWVGNAFDRLHALDQEGERYAIVVLDPPAFAKNRRSIPNARRGYKEINLRALKILEPGGILITCSCSYHLSREELIGIVAEAAADARRAVELIEIRGQARDHPIVLTAPETAYLKCLVLRAR